MFGNDFHDYYEWWPAGVQCEDLLVVAAPCNEIATWAVYFKYFYQDESNKHTLHGGAPIIKGEKWVMTQWMRRRALL